MLYPLVEPYEQISVHTLAPVRPSASGPYTNKPCLHGREQDYSTATVPSQRASPLGTVSFVQEIGPDATSARSSDSCQVPGGAPSRVHVRRVSI